MRSRLLDVAVALAAVVAAVTTPSGLDRRPSLVLVAVGGTWMAGLALRSVAPLVAVAWLMAGMVTYVVVQGSAQLPVWAFVTALWLSFGVGLLLDGRGRLRAASIMLPALLVLALLDHGADDFADRWVSPLVILGAPMLAGALIRRSRLQADDLRRVTTALAAEREAHAREAAAAERNRIARELHDVISHSVSVMVVQAGAADQLLPQDSPARQQVQAVRDTGRYALAELRQQLGMLREGPDARPLPVPSLVDLGRLADDAGAAYEAGDPDDLAEVPPGAALTAYRVAQEALTNARKHAAGGSVRVSAVRDGEDLRVEVVNTRGARLADTPGAGRGLEGMRERVELYAGRLEVGPTSERGWRVCAVLPVGTP